MLGTGIHTDAVMDRVIHESILIDTGSRNMREKIGAVQNRRTRWKPLASNGNFWRLSNRRIFSVRLTPR
ncbi:hypothetical protein CQ018_14905 [Arthrobacter sp. MYb227]|nr:hypothetical protein CQ018_14905 [Arthrobacter sp. MYb227]